MKKLLLFLSLFLLFLSFGSTPLWALTPPEKIEIGEQVPYKDQGRSVVLRPQATFYADQNLLEVRFYAEQHYIVKVVDAMGATLFVSQLITDGGNHTYVLPCLPPGVYKISLEGPTKSYAGTFTGSR